MYCCQIKGYATIPRGAVVPVLLNWHLRSFFGFRKHNTVVFDGVYIYTHALSALL